MDRYIRKDRASLDTYARSELVDKGWRPLEIEQCWEIVKPVTSINRLAGYLAAYFVAVYAVCITILFVLVWATA